MKIYISGAITGTDDYVTRFGKAEARLRNQGFEVINPAEVNGRLPKSTTYEQYMEMSMLMLGMCDSIYMLKGWESSKGSNREYGYAVGKDLSIIFE